MPGLTGIIGSAVQSPAALEELEAMASGLVHESSYISGKFSVAAMKLVVVWADHPEGLGAHAPVWNAQRDVGLIFIGEDHSLASSTEECRVRGIAAVDGCQSVLQLYEREGTRFLTRLNGSFAGVVLDLRNRRTILFNDRFGLGRIYLHEAAGTLYFSSEAKCLLAVLPHLRKIDQRGLAEFFSIGCVLQNRTLFPGISLLPGGSCWTIDSGGGVSRERYFDPSDWENQPVLSPSIYGERLKEVFGRIVPRYTNSAHRVGMSLTGGLDSRMLLAWARAAPGAMPCYTFGGPYRDCADLRIARLLADVTKQPHRTIYVGDAFLADFENLAERTVRISDATMDVSGAVELYVNRQARQIAPIRLTGNYGSEILRLNVAFRPGRMDHSLFTPDFVKYLREAEQTYREENRGHRLSFIAFKQVPWHHYARRSVEYSQLIPRSPFLDNELVALAYQVPEELYFSAQPLMELIESGNPQLDKIGTDRAHRSRSARSANPVVKAWREFTARAEYAYDYGMPPTLAKIDHALRGLHLEKLFLGRHKFYHFRVWYRDRLNEQVKRLALDLSTPPECYRDGAVKEIVLGHCSGRVNRTLELHKLLSVQLMEKFSRRPA